MGSTNGVTSAMVGGVQIRELDMDVFVLGLGILCFAIGDFFLLLFFLFSLFFFLLFIQIRPLTCVHL